MIAYSSLIGFGEPCLAHETAELAAVAAQLLADREAAYPSLVERKALRAEEAKARIDAMQAIVADWRRIVELEADRPAGARDTSVAALDKLATLELAIGIFQPRVAKARAALREALTGHWRRAIEEGEAGRDELHAAWADGRIKGPEVELFLHAERRLWAMEALHWHYTGPRHVAFHAEINARWRAERQARAAA